MGLKRILEIAIVLFFGLGVNQSASAFLRLSVPSQAQALEIKKQRLAILRQKANEIKKIEKDFYYQTAKTALKQFRTDSMSDNEIDLDLLFLKLEKRIIYQTLTKEQLKYFNFENLTQSVIEFVGDIKNNFELPAENQLRNRLQLKFYGLSQAIKKANEMNLTIQSEQFEKLHNILISQSTTMYYAAYMKKSRFDLFWTSYFLHELNYPMDLTAKHLASLDQNLEDSTLKVQFKIYGSKLAKQAMKRSDQLGNVTQDQIDHLYKWATYVELEDDELQGIQKSYLKQLQILGDSEKVKEFKKQLASQLLYRETKNVFHHPLSLFKYIQFLIGYIFVAWPLEMILVLFSLGIFSYQASSVLSQEEFKKAKRIDKRLWMMFTKSYLGSNVPFFSKFAASLILFGIGLYFNSAKNFVESMIANL